MPAGVGEERFDLRTTKIVELLGTSVVIEETQELGDRCAVHFDRADGEATDTLKVPPVVRDAKLGGRQRRRR